MPNAQVSLKVYWKYIQAVGPTACLISLLIFGVKMFSTVYSGIWLADWTDDPYLANTSLSHTQKYKDKTDLYIGVYAGLGFVQGDS